MFRSAVDQSLLLRAETILLKLFPRLLGMMFTYAGILKARDMRQLTSVLIFDNIPVRFVTPLSYAVVASEIGLGLLLILFPPRRWLLSIAIVVLIVYSGQLAKLALAKTAPDCGCLRIDPNTEAPANTNEHREHVVGLVRNGLILLACVWTWMLLPTITQRSEITPRSEP